MSLPSLLEPSAMLLRLLVALRGGRRLRRVSEAVDDPGILAVLRRPATRLGLRAAPAAAWCRRVAAPTVVGVVRPMILLPLSLASGLTPEQVAAVLTHELAHIRRWDHLVNVLQRLVEAALFFHPAVWLLSRRVRVEREHCCDGLVLAAGGEPLAYAASLVHLAERAVGSRREALALGATGRPSSLRRRTLRLVGGPSGESARLVRSWPLALLAVGFVLAVGYRVHSAEPAAPPGPMPLDRRDNTAEGGDRPRADIWREYPALKRQHAEGLKRLEDWLTSLEPVAFAAEHGALAKQARSADRAARLRAWKGIAALRDPTALPLLIEAARAEDQREQAEATAALATWVYDAYHPARRVPKDLAPMLPFFLETLTGLGDRPNARSSCFQAIGCLAAAEWLPLVKDLAASRHPAVAHWSGWAMKEIAARAPAKPVADAEADALPRWVDSKTGEAWFGVGDIVRFDWEKQLFELRRRRGEEFQWFPVRGEVGDRSVTAKHDAIATELRRIVAIREQGVARIQRLFKAGAASEAEVAQARVALAEARLRLAQRLEALGAEAPERP